MLDSTALSNHTFTFLITKCIRETFISVFSSQPTMLFCFFFFSKTGADIILISLLFSFLLKLFFSLFKNKLERDLIRIKEAGLCFHKPYFSIFFCFLERVQ